MSKDEKYKILFVCLGNICRSPAAEGIMRRLVEERGLAERVEIDSAGLSGYHAGDLPDRRMRVHARRRGLELTHRSRPVSSSDFEKFDMIVAMDDSNYDCLRDMAGTLEEEAKVVRIASFFRHYTTHDCVPDPYYGGAEGFENVLNLLEDACEGIINEIIKLDK